MQGEDNAVVDALSRGDVEAAPVDTKMRKLLEFVALLTRQASGTTPDTIEPLREVGWSDEEISEAVYITALFAFFSQFDIR